MTTPNRQDRRKAASKGGGGKVTTAAQFKKKRDNDIVTLPSGNRVRVRRPGMIKFLEAGFLPDPLAQLIKKEIAQRTGKVQESDLFKSILGGEDMEMLKEMMRATDRITAFCVVEPTVMWHERESEENGVVVYEDIPEDERDEEIVYTDEMEVPDKMFVFQLAVGGSSDLTRFHQATGSVVGALSAGEGVV